MINVVRGFAGTGLTKVPVSSTMTTEERLRAAIISSMSIVTAFTRLKSAITEMGT